MAILDYGKQSTGDLAKEDLRYDDSNFADMAFRGQEVQWITWL